jgi:hypothetical protein
MARDRIGRRRLWRVGAVLVMLLCGTADPVAADEQPASRVWTLTAGTFSVTGLRYHGVVTTEVGDKQVRALSFTIGELWATDITLVAEVGRGRVLTVTAPSAHAHATPGSPIELLALQLSGTLNILGIGLPIYMSPDVPPLLVLPAITLTDVTAVATDLAGGRLTLTGTQMGTTRAQDG